MDQHTKMITGEEQDSQCTYQRNIEACSCNHHCSGKATSITHYECVFVVFGIQHERRMRRIIMSSVVCPTVPYFFHIIS